MKNILLYSFLIIVGIVIGGLLFKGCSGTQSGSTVIEVVRDTVTVTKTDTLRLTVEPKIIEKKVFVVDNSGEMVMDAEIERLSNYCDDVQAKLAEAYLAISKGERKQVELASLLAKKGVVDMPINHYEKSAKGEKTGVTATIAFDTYGYVKNDSLLLILNEDEATIKETKTIDNTKKNAFGFTGAFRQEIGGNGQELGLRFHMRKNWFVYGIGTGSDVEDPLKPKNIEVFAGFEIGQRKK